MKKTIFPFKTDLAWAAGIVDGEGYIGARFAESRLKLSLRVTMTHLGTIRKLRKLFGGAPVKRYDRGNTKHKVYYLWSSSGQKAATIIKIILPYLVTKKKQATIYLELSNEMSGKEGIKRSYNRIRFQESRVEKLKELNKKGR